MFIVLGCSNGTPSETKTNETPSETPTEPAEQTNPVESPNDSGMDKKNEFFKISGKTASIKDIEFLDPIGIMVEEEGTRVRLEPLTVIDNKLYYVYNVPDTEQNDATRSIHYIDLATSKDHLVMEFDRKVHVSDLVVDGNDLILVAYDQVIHIKDGTWKVIGESLYAIQLARLNQDVIFVETTAEPINKHQVSRTSSVVSYNIAQQTRSELKSETCKFNDGLHSSGYEDDCYFSYGDVVQLSDRVLARFNTKDKTRIEVIQVGAVKSYEIPISANDFAYLNNQIILEKFEEPKSIPYIFNLNNLELKENLVFGSEFNGSIRTISDGKLAITKFSNSKSFRIYSKLEEDLIHLDALDNKSYDWLLTKDGFVLYDAEDNILTIHPFKVIFE